MICFFIIGVIYNFDVVKVKGVNEGCVMLVVFGDNIECVVESCSIIDEVLWIDNMCEIVCDEIERGLIFGVFWVREKGVDV